MNYVSHLVTEWPFVMKDDQEFEAALRALEDLGAPLHVDRKGGHYTSYGLVFVHEDDCWKIYGEDASLDAYWDDVGDALERLPPADWTDEEAKGHEAAFGIPRWLPEVVEEDQLDVIALIQRFMKEDCIACVMYVGNEGLRGVDGLVWVIKHDDCEYMSLHSAMEELATKMDPPPPENQPIHLEVSCRI